MNGGRLLNEIESLVAKLESHTTNKIALYHEKFWLYESKHKAQAKVVKHLLKANNYLLFRK